MQSNLTPESSLPVGGGPFSCEKCGRSYSRKDHLARHRQSHTSQRPYACPGCGKGFGRKDLLRRHCAIHNGQHSTDRSPARSLQHLSSRRVVKACRACAVAKVKCQDEKPCRRCLKQGITCIMTLEGAAPISSSDEHLRDSDGSRATFSPDFNFAKAGICGGSGPSIVRTESFPISSESELDAIMDDTMAETTWFTSEYPLEALQSVGAMETCQLSLIPAPDHCQDASITDAFLTNFELGGGWEELITTGRIRQASEVFRTSMWYSVRNQRWDKERFIGHELSLPLADEDPDSSLREICSSAPQYFNKSTRDGLLTSLIIFARNQSTECLQAISTTFPSPGLLNNLVQLFMENQDRKLDSWIHSVTFEPNAHNMELTTMILAASALNTSSPTLRKLGTNLRRILRPLILDKLETEGEAECKLELYQAFLLSLELDLWHDEDDCLNRAGRLSSIIATFVRQVLEYRRLDPARPPLLTDNAAEVNEKWVAWVRHESLKRLVTRFCVYDNQLSMTLGVRSLMAFSDYRLPAPQPKELWLARSHTEWRQIYLSRRRSDVPRVMDLFTSMQTCPLIPWLLDRDLAMKVNFHLIGGLITEYQLSTPSPLGISMACGEGLDPNGIPNRKRELEHAVRRFEHIFNTDICASHIGSFLVSYMSMTLNISIKSIEILVGKAGEQESHDTYQIMKDWPETAEAREAVWHAGQVLRLFKLLNRLTSFQIIIAYHAGLVLFAYSILSCVSGRLPAAQSDSIICLNDSSPTHLPDFIRYGSSEPVLRSDFRGTERLNVPLLATKEAVEIITEVILNRCCNCEGLSPRLINGLVTLLKDLASAIQIVGGRHPLSSE